jgi:DNA-directed RNA polymerase subunit RPC12/RpoP
MKIVPNDYCNECKKDTDLIVTEITEHSIFAKCPDCGAKFDLISEGCRIKEV